MSGRRSHGGSAGGGKRGSGVQYQRNEPSFLRKLKEQIGYREAVPTLDDKQPDLKNQDSDEGKDDIEKDDEKPVVVVLKEGDLTAEEAQAEAEKTAQDGEASGKMVFRPPAKRSKTDETSKAKVKRPNESTSSVTKSNKKLLSFDEDEEEDEDD